jgi:hypothetical protein
MGICSNCHMHENNQDKSVSKGHEHIMTKINLNVNRNMKHKNQS